MNFRFFGRSEAFARAGPQAFCDRCPPKPSARCSGRRRIRCRLGRALRDGLARNGPSRSLWRAWPWRAELCRHRGGTRPRASRRCRFRPDSAWFAQALLLAGSEGNKSSGLLPGMRQRRVIGTFARVEAPGGSLPRSIRASFRPADCRVQNRGGGRYGGAFHCSRSCAQKWRKPRAGGFRLRLSRSQNSERVRRQKLDASIPRASMRNSLSINVAARAAGSVGEGWRLRRQVLDRAAVLHGLRSRSAAPSLALQWQRIRTHAPRLRARDGSFQRSSTRLADIYRATSSRARTPIMAAWALSTNARELPLVPAAARNSATLSFRFRGEMKACR